MEFANTVSAGMTQEINIKEPVAVVAVTTNSDDSISIQRVGAFESRADFERYIQNKAAMDGGFAEGYSIRSAAGVTEYTIAGLGMDFDVAADSAVAVFKVDSDDGEVEFLSQYKSTEEFRGILDFASSDALSGKVSADVAVAHQDLEEHGYIAVSIGEYVK